MTLEPSPTRSADATVAEHAAGTLGALLSSGGGFTRGLSATHGPVTLTIERAFWERAGEGPGRGFVSFGFIARVQGAVDWRHQWDIVLSGATIGECLGGIYGMPPEQLAELGTRDRPTWRRFLCEVVDPRFGYGAPSTGR